MIACGIQKLSPAQQKKLAKGLPVRVKAGTAHQVPLTSAQAKKLERAKKDNKGMVLSIPPHGGSLFSDAKDWYVNNIPPKYREPIERLVVAGAEDAGVPGAGVVERKHGGSLFSDAKDWYVNNIPPKYREPIERLVVAGAQDAGIPGAGLKKRGRKGKGLLEDITRFPSSFIKGLEMSPGAVKDYSGHFSSVGNYIADHLRTGEPMRLPDGRAPLSLQQWKKGDPLALAPVGRGLATLAKHPVSGRHHLVRHHMAGAGKMKGKGWKEDLEAFNAWTGDIGNKLTGIAKSVDPEGRLQEAGINAIVDYIAPEMKAARIAEQKANALMGKRNPYRPTEKEPEQEKPQQGKRRGRKPKTPVVTAEELPASEQKKDEKVLTAYTQPLPTASIASAFEEQLPYQPVRWFGSGAKGQQSKKKKGGALKPHMVKGSPAAKEHMAKLRAMRSKKMSGSALYPAGY